MAFTEVGKTGNSSTLWVDHNGTFKHDFDRLPFALSHGLADHPLFEISKLLALADVIELNRNNFSYDAGNIGVEDRWSHRPKNPYTLKEAMERIDCSGAWVILKHTEAVPEYRELM